MYKYLKIVNTRLYTLIIYVFGFLLYQYNLKERPIYDLSNSRWFFNSNICALTITAVISSLTYFAPTLIRAFVFLWLVYSIIEIVFTIK